MKRTQILIEPEYWSILTLIAKRSNSSVGGLIRYAIKKTFIDEEQNMKRSRAVESSFADREIVKNIHYKELINDERKY